MTRRERFLATMTYGYPDRPAAGDYFYYDSTRERWEREGLPRGVDLAAYFEMDFDPLRWQVPVCPGVLPPYPVETLGETDEYVVKRQGGGEVVRILKNVPPPAMPQWLRYPLSSRRDWAAFGKLLDPDTPGRLPMDMQALAASYQQRDYPLGMWIGGSYGFLREWWGVEGLSLLLYDDPALVEEMMERLTHLFVTLLERVLASRVDLDWVFFWEDMAYKTGPLISPALYRKFCEPFYTAIMERVRRARIPVVMMDSDGDISELIPFWLDMGITVMHPMEVAAGMDVVRCRGQYGRQIGFYGGIDKRACAGTRADIRREVLPKLEACLGEGGFIPAFDHAIPPDVSFDNYRYFRDLIRQASQ